uniref:Uncharacterized protein n=1 Tax=Oryza nivara TaxID=4536 RepID=A0A0E0I6H8_ORYNI
MSLLPFQREDRRHGRQAARRGGKAAMRLGGAGWRGEAGDRRGGMAAAAGSDGHRHLHPRRPPQPNRDPSPSSKPATPSSSGGGIRHLQLPPRRHQAPLPQARHHEGRLLLLILRRRHLRIILARGLLLVANQEDGRGAAASGEGSLLPLIRVSEWAGGDEMRRSGGDDIFLTLGEEEPRAPYGIATLELEPLACDTTIVVVAAAGAGDTPVAAGESES